MMHCSALLLFNTKLETVMTIRLDYSAILLQFEFSTCWCYIYIYRLFVLAPSYFCVLCASLCYCLSYSMR